MELQLNPRETSLLESFRRLSPETSLRPNTRIDWSDSWSDKDLEEFTAAPIRRLEADDVVVGPTGKTELSLSPR
jgi:hypothetical protein